MFESSVIAEYLDEISPGSLHARDAFEKARNRAWIEFAFGPVFRYFEVIGEYDDLGFFDGLAHINTWREALAARPSVQGAVVDDYHERLRDFIEGLGSELVSFGR